MTKETSTLIESLLKDMRSNNFEQQSRVEKIDAYRASEFHNRKKDKRDYFYNISNQSIDVATKKTDIPVSGIELNIHSDEFAHLFKKGFREFADDVDLEQVLCDMINSWYTYGNAVLKVVRRKKRSNILYVVPFPCVINHPCNFDLGPIVETKQIGIHELRMNKVYYNGRLDELEESIRSSNLGGITHDSQTITVYELCGYLHDRYLGKKTDKMSHQRHIVAEYDNQYYTLFSGETDKPTYYVATRKKLHNRAQGMSIVEELFESQKAVNENVNLAQQQLRSTAMVMWQSADPRLQGFNVEKNGKFNIITHEPEGRITQVSTAPTSFGALTAQRDAWKTQGQEQSFSNKLALGKNLPSRTPFRTVDAVRDEGDTKFEYERKQLEKFLRRVFKECVLDMIIDYFDSPSAITDLLLPQELSDFYGFVAKKIGDAQLNKMQASGEAIYDIQAIYDQAKKSIEGQELTIKMDTKIDRKRLIDKVRFKFSDGNGTSDRKLRTLESLYRIVAQNPQAAPAGFTPAEILQEILRIDDIDQLGRANNRSAFASQSAVQTPSEQPLNTSPQALQGEVGASDFLTVPG